MDKNSFKRKVVITSEIVSPEARAQRLRQVRNMANLSRKDMCSDGTMNLSTYKGWESARAGGLSIDGAKRVIERVKKEGVICTLEWLIYGKGFSAYVVNESIPAPNKSKDSEVTLILNEMYLFKKQFPEVVHYQIADDGLMPQYYPKDFVAGLKHQGTDLTKLLNKNCIVRLKNDQTLTRCLKRGNKPHTFLLYCTNPTTTEPNITVSLEDIVDIAIISRYYKINFPEQL